PRGQVPDKCRRAVAYPEVAQRRQQLAVRGEAAGEDVAALTFVPQPAAFLARGCFPDADRRISAARHQALAVGGKLDPDRAALVTGQLLYLPARERLPKPNAPVQARGSQS